MTSVSSLLDKSLVIKDDVGGVACYRLHETMREYAASEDRARQMRRIFSPIATSTTTGPPVCPPRTGARFRLADWLAWVELEIDNIRAVLQDCVLRHDSARGLDIAASLRYYWVTHGTTESVRWLDQLLASDDASPQTLVSAYYLRGWLSVLQADPAAARPWLARAVAVARVSSQLPQLVEALSMSANVENMLGNAAGARQFLDEADALAADANDYVATIELIQAQTVHAFFEGDMEAVTARVLRGRAPQP